MNAELVGSDVKNEVSCVRCPCKKWVKKGGEFAQEDCKYKPAVLVCGEGWCYACWQGLLEIREAYANGVLISKEFLANLGSKT